MFATLERGPFAEGYKIDVVGGAVHMTPQRDNHWDITRGLLRQLGPTHEHRRLLSDVRIDYPGELNAFCSDVALVAEGAERTERGGFLCEDVEFVAEVISRGTAENDYGPKKTGYATAGVAVYLVVDPYQGKSRVHTRPERGDYRVETTVDFGEEIDLTHTLLGVTVDTSGFGRE
ncbi:Uma2 family endonuclease [Streptomyces sp. A1499]|nr:Uma2 family endonuclease [Streptomyces sp. A1499]